MSRPGWGYDPNQSQSPSSKYSFSFCPGPKGFSLVNFPVHPGFFFIPSRRTKKGLKVRKEELKSFLEEKYHQYNQPEFILTDPVQVPKKFSDARDIEIAGFFSATLAWGQRCTIIRNASRLMRLMGHAPFDFVMGHGKKDLEVFNSFVHRTFNGTDTIFFIQSLQHIYKKYGSLGALFTQAYQENQSVKEALAFFRAEFFSSPHPARTGKHISDVNRNSAAKRLNMFTRWMVRKDRGGVDLGIWKDISPAHLFIPLDLHVAKVARSLGLLQRKQNDWKAVEELTARLRELDPEDPVKYDYALFGLGLFEGFGK
jgi:uncharacterized protein (TIGR02757 family)